MSTLLAPEMRVLKRKVIDMAKKARCYEIDRGHDAEDSDTVAKNLFEPENKNPYYLRGKEIKNLDELKENLQSFKDTEAMWVADWIRYLGDPKTADQIRNRPKEFKRIIDARYAELLNHLDC
jgi:hypothetical protein